jgi:hypothetical protein
VRINKILILIQKVISAKQLLQMERMIQMEIQVQSHPPQLIHSQARAMEVRMVLHLDHPMISSFKLITNYLNLFKQNRI